MRNHPLAGHVLSFFHVFQCDHLQQIEQNPYGYPWHIHGISMAYPWQSWQSWHNHGTIVTFYDQFSQLFPCPAILCGSARRQTSSRAPHRGLTWTQQTTFHSLRVLVVHRFIQSLGFIRDLTWFIDVLLGLFTDTGSERGSLNIFSMLSCQWVAGSWVQRCTKSPSFGNQ